MDTLQFTASKCRVHSDNHTVPSHHSHGIHIFDTNQKVMYKSRHNADIIIDRGAIRVTHRLYFVQVCCVYYIFVGVIAIVIT